MKCQLYERHLDLVNMLRNLEVVKKELHYALTERDSIPKLLLLSYHTSMPHCVVGVIKAEG